MMTQKQSAYFTLIVIFAMFSACLAANADTSSNAVTSANTSAPANIATSPSTVTSAPPVDKSQYNLLDPTPVALMRDFSTDRPDKTDGPRTVDAGHFQLEMDWANYTDSKNTIDGDSTRFQQYQILPMNIRLGVTNNSEVNLIMETYNIQKIHDYTADTKQYLEGYGDTDLRYKLNLSGNDTDGLATGLISYIKIPSNHDNLGNHSVEGGQSYVVDFSWLGFDIGAETEVDGIRNSANDSFHAEFINSITVHRDIIANILNAYVEFYGDIPSNNDFSWVGTVDTGLLWAVTKNIQLDCGVNIGVTKGADQWNPFTGISVRF